MNVRDKYLLKPLPSIEKKKRGSKYPVTVRFDPSVIREPKVCPTCHGKGKVYR